MRIRIEELEPKAYKIMYAFEDYLKDSLLTSTYIELIKMRASQLNRCAFCLNMHTRDALKEGETETRINMLPVWQEVPALYNEKERVILQMTEEITDISHGLSDETYNKATSLFSDKEVAQIIVAIVVINSWNRLGVSTRLEDTIHF